MILWAAGITHFLLVCGLVWRICLLRLVSGNLGRGLVSGWSGELICSWQWHGKNPQGTMPQQIATSTEKGQSHCHPSGFSWIAWGRLCHPVGKAGAQQSASLVWWPSTGSAWQWQLAGGPGLQQRTRSVTRWGSVVMWARREVLKAALQGAAQPIF